MPTHRLGALVASVLLFASGCASTYQPQTIQPGNCKRAAMECTIATTALSGEQRRELDAAIEARITDRTLLAVRYDGVHLQLVPDCVIAGRYARRDLAGERELDADAAMFVVHDPELTDGFVRTDSPGRANFWATERIAAPRVGRAPRDPACMDVTHVVQEVIVGVDLRADGDERALPVALVLDELPVELPPADRPELTDEQIASLILFVVCAGIRAGLDL